MSYSIVFTQRAIKDLKNLEPQTKQRIVDKLKFFSLEPLKYAKKLTNPQIGTYRFRIGEYRVVFDLDGLTIVVLRVGHRKQIYG